MTELENLMVEKMKEILANQTLLATQLDEISKHLKSVDKNQEGFAIILEKHSKVLDSFLPPGTSTQET